MKGCRITRGRIERAVDARLPLEERFLLDEHLASCPRCRARFERACRVQELLERRPDPPVEHLDPEQAVASIRRSIEAARERDARNVARPARRRWIAAAAALVVIGGATVFWLSLRVAQHGGDRGGDRVPDRAARSRDGSEGAPRVGVEPLSDESDAHRLAAVREEVRAHLLTAFAGFPAGGDPLPGSDRFDEEVRPLRRAEWPVLRIVEDLLSDDEERTVRCAARYLGVRGDRATAVRLGAARATSSAKGAIVRALGDLGVVAVPALAAALDDWTVGDLAAAELGRIGGRRAADALEAEILRATDDAFRRETVLYPSLVAAGPAALESLLRLADERPDEAAAILGRLPEVRDADAAFARAVRTSFPRVPTSLLLEAAAHLQSPQALAWVEERSADYGDRSDALACLARWGGPAPLEVVLRLDARGTVSDGELLSTLGELIDRDPERLTDFVTARIESRAAADVERLLGLLLATENPWASESLVRIALSDLLPVDSRQWAALAVGELGDADDAEELLARLPDVARDENRLLAACLITIHVHLGPGGASRALEGLAVKRSSRVLSALSEVNPSGTGAVGLHRVARALDKASGDRYPKPRRSTL